MLNHSLFSVVFETIASVIADLLHDLVCLVSSSGAALCIASPYCIMLCHLVLWSPLPLLLILCLQAPCPVPLMLQHTLCYEDNIM